MSECCEMLMAQQKLLPFLSDCSLWRYTFRYYCVSAHLGPAPSVKTDQPPHLDHALLYAKFSRHALNQHPQYPPATPQIPLRISNPLPHLESAHTNSLTLPPSSPAHRFQT